MSVPGIVAVLLSVGTPIGSEGVAPAAFEAPFAIVAIAQEQELPAPAVPAASPAQEQPAPATPKPPTAATPPAPRPTDQRGDIVVTARPRAVAGDPLQQVNADSFAATQAVDRALVGPVALTYKRTVPKPIRTGLRNVLNNLREPVVFLNFLLQLKPGKAVETVGRFSVNSTVGVGGLIDVAKNKPFNLPRRPNGFANTMGYYGVKPGPFLFMPLIGPTTLRDLIGGGVDRLVLPLSVGAPFTKAYYSIPTGILSAVDYRAEFDEQLNKLREDYPDPYAAARAYYLNRRQAEIDALHAMGHTKGSTPPRPAITPVEAVFPQAQPAPAPAPANDPPAPIPADQPEAAPAQP